MYDLLSHAIHIYIYIYGLTPTVFSSYFYVIQYVN